MLDCAELQTPQQTGYSAVIQTNLNQTNAPHCTGSALHTSHSFMTSMHFKTSIKTNSAYCFYAQPDAHGRQM